MRRAFTMIELLCALALIVLMLALIIPAIGKAKRRANEVRHGVWYRQWVERGLMNGWINAKQYDEMMEQLQGR